MSMRNQSLRYDATTALNIARDLDEGEDVNKIIKRILFLAVDLDYKARKDPIYFKIMYAKPEEEEAVPLTKMEKLEALIAHPLTPAAEREVAMRMLDNLATAAVTEAIA